ncbi:epoxide hydrolase A-like [Tripterygium wilfordii]|uniref:epoxide hydrolase A-like n=1 Tax=Tripterygium wilfordii TaxID=458696 RepID=UPI0018F86457|nr:epoxide hydrolase A-like [Tripterygium wilfordii]
MEKIEHTTVSTNGIKMHVASIGTGPVILFIHGFPELWYSWRHQLLSLSSRGYRCIAPDLRGYGDTDAPPSPNSYSVHHLVGDLVGLLDALAIEQVFLVGHDWGAYVAWWFCLLRPDRVKALVNLSVPFMPRNPKIKPIDGFRAVLGNDFYGCRFQEPGEIEEEFAQFDTATVLRKFFALREPHPLFLPKQAGLKGLPYDSSLTPWLSKEDIDYFASKYSQKGFTGGLNYYRVINISWELTGPWTGAQVKIPTKFVIGNLDLVYYMPGIKDYIHGGGFKKEVPYLEDVVVMEGVAHFIQQEKPEEINDHIYDFIKTF